jgi:predicted dehydrogenase
LKELGLPVALNTSGLDGSAESLLLEAAHQHINTIFICTPPPTHARFAIAAASCGLHVLVEKPLATTTEDADKMIAMAKAADTVLSVVSQRRWLPATLAIKEAIDGGALGNRIILGSAVVEDRRTEEDFDRAEWRQTWEGSGGGVLMQQAPHVIDLLLWFMGKPVEVFGYTHNLTHQRIAEMEDNVVAVIRFENGPLATLRTSISHDPPLRLNSVSVTGENGHTVSIDTMDHLTGYNHVWTLPRSTYHQLKYRRPHTCQIADFLEAIKEGRPPAVTAEEGRQVVAVIQGIYKSMEVGGPVGLC